LFRVDVGSVTDCEEKTKRELPSKMHTAASATVRRAK